MASSPGTFIRNGLTHAKHNRELKVLSHHYMTTPQKDSIAAAKAWHSQFPADDLEGSLQGLPGSIQG